MMLARLASAVVVLEAIVVALTIPVIKAFGNNTADVSLVIAAVVALLLTPGVIRRPRGVWIGWAVQIFTVFATYQIPEALILSLLFVWLWVLALRWGGRIDRDRAQWSAENPE
jgi:hypothetical protein